MRRLWRSTFGLAAIVSALFALATLVIGVVAYEVTHEALEQQLDHRTSIETRALMTEPGADRMSAIAQAIHRRERAASVDHLSYLLVDASGRRIAGSLKAAPPEAVGFEEFLSHDGDRIAQSLTTVIPGGGRLVVAADRGALSNTDQALIILFASAFGAMLLLGVGGAWTVGALTAARLRRIDRAALAIIGGDLQHRMPVDGSGSEFDQVSITLNRMLDRISSLMENLRQVSSDVAHDLRTPLTRLSNRLHDAHIAIGDDRDSAIEAAVSQAEELLEIFAALLRISEVEALGVRRHFRRIRLGDDIGELLETYRPDAEASGHLIDDAVNRSIVVRGDRRLLLQLMSNLLDNALRHTPPGTIVKVTLEAMPGGVRLAVVDNGPGIGTAKAERIFQRFSRTESSRSNAGHGLGLALVKAIAEAHYGEASLMPEPGFGVVIVLQGEVGGSSCYQ